MDATNGPHLSAWHRGVIEMGLWKYWLSTMSPERLAQQRQYDTERGKKYYQEHKEEMQKRKKEHYERNRERLTEKHVCDACGGSYTIQHRTQHTKTKKHQAAIATQNATSNT